MCSAKITESFLFCKDSKKIQKTVNISFHCSWGGRPKVSKYTSNTVVVCETTIYLPVFAQTPGASEIMLAGCAFDGMCRQKRIVHLSFSANTKNKVSIKCLWKPSAAASQTHRPFQNTPIVRPILDVLFHRLGWQKVQWIIFRWINQKWFDICE